jgi:hypothetical protein
VAGELDGWPELLGDGFAGEDVENDFVYGVEVWLYVGFGLVGCAIVGNQLCPFA